MHSNVAESWGRIEAWLRANRLPGHLSLPPGAPDQAIRAAEVAMGLVLPQEVQESYRIHDGTGRLRARVYLTDMTILLPLVGEYQSVVTKRERMLKLAEDMSDLGGMPDGPIKGDWWNPRWVPLGDDEQSALICIDLDPPQNGCVGQVIEYRHTAETRVLARSWGEWLANLAVALEAGRYRLAGHESAVWLEDILEMSEEQQSSN